jgi:hypothetical protein
MPTAAGARLQLTPDHCCIAMGSTMRLLLHMLLPLLLLLPVLLLLWIAAS